MSKYAGFNSVELTKPPRSMFDLSNWQRLTTRATRLTTVLVRECVPGDTWNGSSEILLRVAPLLAPIYDSLRIYVHYFFVPYRLLWSEWETFITGGRLGVGIDPVNAPLPPYYRFQDMADYAEVFSDSNLLDYLGMPNVTALTGFSWEDFEVLAPDAKFEVLVPLAYQKVWMDYYRDRNFIPDDYLDFPVPSGNILATHPPLQYLINRQRGWEHDYFTSALPFTQRGEEVLMPLAGQGSVTYLDQSVVLNTAGNPVSAGQLQAGDNLGNDVTHLYDDANGGARIQNIDEVLLTASSVSINDFRSAYALQVWLERNAVGGSRYNESTQAHFGVRPQDSRLQRPEYIGGGLMPVRISEIVSTAYSDDGTDTVPLANLAGHGISYGTTNQFRYFTPEHGVILGIASITYPGSYYQGMPRHFLRSTFLDYPWPTFAKLGEQPVYNYELYALPVNFVDDEAGEKPVFGYQSRYADWKNAQNSTHGAFRTSLNFWHLSRTFTGTPVLGETFTVMQGQEQNRIFAVQGDSDNFWLYVNNQVRVKRCLPYFGTPNTLGFS